VDGDGLLDLVAGSAWTSLPGASNAGAVYVWKGKPTWLGTVAPDATLVIPGAHLGDALGVVIGGSQGIVFGDVTGDGQPDLVVGASFAEVNGVNETGAVYVWAGGSSLAGTPAPTATLSVPGANAFQHLARGAGLCNLGMGGCTQTLLLHDVSGDGTADVLTLTTRARVAGVDNVGAVHVWRGGAGLSGPLAPTATLAVPGAVVNDSLGTITGSGGLLVADVSGDDIADVVSGSYLADVGGTQNRGAIYVWQGGPALTGTIAPMATLVSASVRLGDLDYSDGVSLLDWNADSVLDLLVGSAGGLFLWQGGATLAGNPAPSAVLDAGVSDSASSRLSLRDVTGDGLPDVVAGSPWSTRAASVTAARSTCGRAGRDARGRSRRRRCSRTHPRSAATRSGASSSPTSTATDSRTWSPGRRTSTFRAPRMPGRSSCGPAGRGSSAT